MTMQDSYVSNNQLLLSEICMLMQKNIIFHTKDFVYENSWDLIVHFCFECAWLRNKIWSELTYHVDGLNQ